MLRSCLEHRKFNPHLAHRSQAHAPTGGAPSSQHILIDALWPALVWVQPGTLVLVCINLGMSPRQRLAGSYCGIKLLFSFNNTFEGRQSFPAYFSFFVCILFHVFLSVTFMQKFFNAAVFCTFFFFCEVVLDFFTLVLSDKQQHSEEWEWIQEPERLTNLPKSFKSQQMCGLTWGRWIDLPVRANIPPSCFTVGRFPLTPLWTWM